MCLPTVRRVIDPLLSRLRPPLLIEPGNPRCPLWSIQKEKEVKNSDMFLAVTITSCLSLGLTWLVRHLARRYGILAHPRGDRWHNRPTALLGGVAIVASFLWGLSPVLMKIAEL